MFILPIQTAFAAGTGLACLIEWGVCLCFCFFCIFFCHVCVEQQLTYQEYQNQLRRINMAYFNGQPICTATVNYLIINFELLTMVSHEPTYQPVPNNYNGPVAEATAVPAGQRIMTATIPPGQAPGSVLHVMSPEGIAVQVSSEYVCFYVDYDKTYLPICC